MFMLQRQIRQKHKMGFSLLGFRFPIFQNLQQMSFIIKLRHKIVPISILFVFPEILLQLFQFLVFFPYAWDAPFFKPQQILPIVVPASAEESLTGVQAVCAQADRQSSEILSLAAASA